MVRKKKDDVSILGRAMLVYVSIGMWTARKHDKRVTEKVNEEMAHNPEAGRYHKRLFGGKNTVHSKLVTAVQQARNTHYAQTLPWEDTGWRLLPTANYFEYTEIMRAAQARFEAALEQFLEHYQELVKASKELLGDMYNVKDYPSVTEIRHKFHFDIDYAPVPAGQDFRVDLPEAELRAMTKQVESRVHTAVQTATQEIWQRLGDTVHEIRGYLDDGKFLRDTMIDRVREMAELLGRLNLNNDPKLEATRQKVLTDLAGLRADSIKNNEKVRTAAAKKADDILKSMKGVYTPPPPQEDK